MTTVTTACADCGRAPTGEEQGIIAAAGVEVPASWSCPECRLRRESSESMDEVMALGRKFEQEVSRALGKNHLANARRRADKLGIERPALENLRAHADLYFTCAFPSKCMSSGDSTISTICEKCLMRMSVVAAVEYAWTLEAVAIRRGSS